MMVLFFLFITITIFGYIYNIMLVKYFSIYLALISIFTVAGFFLSGLLFKNAKVKFNFFYNLLIGITFFVVLFSIVSTLGKTINVVLVIALAVALMYKNKNNNIINKEIVFPYDFKSIAYFFLAATLIFIVSVLQFTNSHGIPLTQSASDINFYSEVSEFIYSTGEENIFTALNFISKDYLGTNPFHYYELWLSSGVFSLLTGMNIEINHYTLFIFVIYPVLFFVIYLGVVNLFLIFNEKINGQIYLISFLFLFISGFVLPEYGSKVINSTIDLYSNVLFLRHKLAVILILLLLATDFILRGDTFNGLKFVIIIPIVYITILPAVLGGIILFLVVNYYLKFLSKKEVYGIIIFQLLIIVLIGCFYFLTGNKNVKTGTSFGLNDILLPGYDIKYQFRRFIPVIKTPLLTFLAYFPYLIISAYIIFKSITSYLADSYKVIVILFLSTAISGIAAWVILYYKMDAFQMAHNLSCVFFNLLLWIVFIKYFSSKESKSKLVVISIYLFLIINLSTTLAMHQIAGNLATGNLSYDTHINDSEIYSDKYLQEVKVALGEMPKVKIGATLFDSSKYTDIFRKKLIVNSGGFYLKYLANGTAVVSLSDFNVPISTNNFSIGSNAFEREIDIEHVQNASFYRYVNTLKSSNLFLSVEDAQLKFIKEKKILYLIKSPGYNLPALLENIIKKKITDVKTGESFLILQEY
jgi:hypothetical protein